MMVKSLNIIRCVFKKLHNTIIIYDEIPRQSSKLQSFSNKSKDDVSGAHDGYLFGRDR